MSFYTTCIMAVLPDHMIRDRIESDPDFTVEPFDEEEQLQPASVDIRLGDDYENKHTGEEFTDCDKVVFEPETHYLATTEEWIAVPADLSARVEGRSSIGRMGLQIHTTAGWVDPGFEGEITFEVYNLHNEPIELEPGQRVGQLVYLEMAAPAEEPYGEKEGSKYQNQEGATDSRLHLEIEGVESSDI